MPRPPTLRACPCCNRQRKTTDFSHSYLGYAQHCKECGVWLALFRRVFSKPRDVALNRAKARKRSFENHARSRNHAGVVLQDVWR